MTKKALLLPFHPTILTCVLIFALPAIASAAGYSQQDQTFTGAIPHTKTFPGIFPAPYPYANAEDVGLDTETLQALSDTTLKWISEDQIVGAELLVIKDGHIILHEAMGWSDREANIPLSRNTIYRLRSMTKPFTGAAALLLIQDGQLSLISKAAAFLPAWKNKKSAQITIKQLLTHTSGFEQGGTPKPASQYPDLASVTRESGRLGPQHTPGDKFIYSDINSFALGSIVAKRAGKSLEAYIQQHLLDPLQLQDTYIGYTKGAAWASRVNPTYEKNEDGEWVQYWTPEEAQVFPYFRASGGILSTAFDYARWLDIWANNTVLLPATNLAEGRLLSEDLVREALKSHGRDAYADYGFHWEIYQTHPLIFGHAGSDGTLAVAIPSEQILLLYFTQSRRNGTTQKWLRLAQKAMGID
ncbi:MAG: serine hydrolase domain-containing protein [Bacteroidota bacterium]